MMETITPHPVRADRHHKDHYAQAGLMSIISNHTLGNAFLSTTQLPNPAQ